MPPHLHTHGHDHAHGHSPSAERAWSRAYLLGFILNVAFVIFEAAAGLVTNSLALLADAGHNLSDVVALALAWVAAALSRRRPSLRYTYGLRGSSIWAALLNALLLLIACGAIAWEAVQRLSAPAPTPGLTIIVVAAVGVVINTATALLFVRGQKEDLNRRGVFLHMAADAGVSLGVVLAGGLILLTGWSWLDPAISLVIVVVIVLSTWKLLTESMSLALHAVPAGINPSAVIAYLHGLPGVSAIHDLHIWAMSTAENALTVHMVMPDGRPDDRFYSDLAHELEHRFGIHHATVQIERGDGSAACRQASDEVV